MLRSFRLRALLVTGVATLVLLGTVFVGISSAATRCSVVGGGAIAGDRFGGRAGPFRDGGVDGRWTHVTSDGRTLRADVDFLSCTQNGGDPGRPTVDFSIGVLSGTGTFDGQDVDFRVRVEDDGEPGAGQDPTPTQKDVYGITITDADGTLLYNTAGRIDSGDIQVLPANPGRP